MGEHPGERPQAEFASFHSLELPLNAESQVGIFCRFTEGWFVGTQTEFGEDINEKMW